MSKFTIAMTGLIITVSSTCSIAGIKQIQQKRLNQVQLKQIEIEEISKDNNPESIQKAKQQIKAYLKILEETPRIPFIAEPSRKFNPLD